MFFIYQWSFGLGFLGLLGFPVTGEGQGAFGLVYDAREIKSGQAVVCKAILVPDRPLLLGDVGETFWWCVFVCFQEKK